MLKNGVLQLALRTTIGFPAYTPNIKTPHSRKKTHRLPRLVTSRSNQSAAVLLLKTADGTAKEHKERRRWDLPQRTHSPHL
jgi:hypothetical protein